jgi:hypothetical protein
MMGRMNMGRQIATAPASRLPVVTQLDKTRAMATKKWLAVVQPKKWPKAAWSAVAMAAA